MQLMQCNASFEVIDEITNLLLNRHSDSKGIINKLRVLMVCSKKYGFIMDEDVFS